MNMRAILAAGLLGLSASLALAQADADKDIEYRQGVYRAMEWNLSELAAQVQGRSEFDAADFVRRAGRVAFLGGIVPEGFANADSARGTEVETRASYRIWQQKEEFDQLMAHMQQRGQRLYEAAQMAEDSDELRPLLGRLAQSCKACHDKYRD